MTANEFIALLGTLNIADPSKTEHPDIWSGETHFIATVSNEDLGRREQEIVAARLVACWNACQGISTEALNAGVVSDMATVAGMIPKLASWNSGARITHANGKGTLAGVTLGIPSTKMLLRVAKTIDPLNLPANAEGKPVDLS